MSKTALKKKKRSKALTRPPRDNYKREFHRELMRLLKAFDMLDCWQRLSPEIQDNLMNLNIVRPWRYRRDREAGVEEKVLAAWKKDIKEIFDAAYIDLRPFNSELSFRDFLTAGISLKSSLQKHLDSENPDLEKWIFLKIALDELVTREKMNPIRLAGIQTRNLTFICTSIDSYFYFERRDFHHPDHLEPYFCITYTLTRRPAQKRHIIIDEKRRPVFRVGIPRRGGIDWAFVKSDDLKMNGKSRKLRVYVQSHCLKRLQERLIPLKRAKLQVLLYEAFENPDFSTGPDGSRFATLKYEGCKVGYLLFQIIHKMVVVKTFLFITQNGTHEGNMLNREYNLSKYSKSYFELDRLYTFSNTDIYKDEELEKIFSECGCGDLFHLWDEQEKDRMTFDKNYAKNLKKIFIQDSTW